MKPLSTNELGWVGYSSYHVIFCIKVALTPPLSIGRLNGLRALMADTRYRFSPNKFKFFEKNQIKKSDFKDLPLWRKALVNTDMAWADPIADIQPGPISAA